MKGGHQVLEFGKSLRPIPQEGAKDPGLPQKPFGPFSGLCGALDLQQTFRREASSLRPGLDQQGPYLLDSFQRDLPLFLQEIGRFGYFPQLIFNFLFSRRGPQGKTKGLPYLGGSIGLQALQEKMKF
jgi:hypothetical protein